MSTASAFNWRWAGHSSGKRMVTAWRDDARGVQWERWCTRSGHPDNAHYGKDHNSYFIDGDEREFNSEAELLAALSSR